MIGFPTFGRTTQTGKDNTSCSRGRELNCGNYLSFRGRGEVSNSVTSPFSPMETLARSQASA